MRTGAERKGLARKSGDRFKALSGCTRARGSVKPVTARRARTDASRQGHASLRKSVSSAAQPTGPMKLVLSYALLALIASVANIGAQDLAISLYSGADSVLLSIAIGYLSKSFLDKRYAFNVENRPMTSCEL